MTKLRQTIAQRLKDAQNTAAILTTFSDVDMSAVMKLRSEFKDLFEKRHGVKLGFMGFFVKACLQALREIPSVNAEIDGDEIVYKNYYHIGVAVSTDRGLVVPVVREADRMGLAEIEARLAELRDAEKLFLRTRDELGARSEAVSARERLVSQRERELDDREDGKGEWASPELTEMEARLRRLEQQQPGEQTLGFSGGLRKLEQGTRPQRPG